MPPAAAGSTADVYKRQTNTIPNTGISLPFFSYGGTSLMMLLGEMGIVLSVSRQGRSPKT